MPMYRTKSDVRFQDRGDCMVLWTQDGHGDTWIHKDAFWELFVEIPETGIIAQTTGRPGGSLQQTCDEEINKVREKPRMPRYRTKTEGFEAEKTGSGYTFQMSSPRYSMNLCASNFEALFEPIPEDEESHSDEMSDWSPYAYSLFARNKEGNGKIATGVVKARSDHEATGYGFEVCHESFPVADGFFSQSVNVFKIPSEFFEVRSDAPGRP